MHLNTEVEEVFRFTRKLLVLVRRMTYYSVSEYQYTEYSVPMPMKVV